MEKYIIALKEIGVKDKIILDIIKQCPVSLIQEVFENNSIEICMSNIALSQCAFFFKDKERVAMGLEQAESLLNKNKKYNIKTVVYGGKGYPERLKSLQDPPVILYYKGDSINELCDRSVACVGTRKPTKFSYQSINYLVPQWVNEGITIISGLAMGVDTLTHISSLAAKGRTAAVLAHGLDVIQPKKNEKLAEEILKYGGALISEYPIGTPAENFRFVNRNRIIVGLSKAVMVFECSQKSGTMHSIEYAQKQHKPIFCPSVGEEISEEKTGLLYLLNNNIAYPIPDGNSYDVLLKAIGYEVQKKSMATLEIKIMYIKALLWNIGLQKAEQRMKKSLEDEFKLKNIPTLNMEGELLNYIICSMKQNQIDINLMIENLVKVLIPR